VGFSRSEARQLLRAGGWMTVSNIVSPLMVSLDRFLIGAFTSASLVAYYTTPYEITSKLTVLPGAISTVLFPTFSAGFGRDDARLAETYRNALVAVLLLTLPFGLVGILFAYDGIRLWIGAEFALRSFRVAQLLSLGFVVNGLAAIPFALVQAAGRSDTTAKLHLIELPIYLIVLLVCLRFRGLEGAALAMLARVSADAILLFLAARRLVREERPPYVFWVVGICAAALAAGSAVHLPLWMRSLACVGTMASIAFAFRGHIGRVIRRPKGAVG
jgi:O-antigen/teichoic acid export membrane protein